MFKGSSPYNRRVMQRKALKRKLGKGWRKLVGEAMARSKRDFLTYVDVNARHVIRLTLGLDASRFWRVARGKEWLDLAPRWRQPERFDTTNEQSNP